MSISLFFAHMRLHFSTNSGMHDRTYKKSSLMIHLLRKVENEPVSGKKKINTYLLLLFSNYLMTLSTVLRIMQFEEAHTGLLCKIVQNSLYFCAGQERASEHTKDLKTHVMLARFAQRPRSTAISPLQLAIHVVQNRLAGKQKSHWDKPNKENYHFKL